MLTSEHILRAVGRYTNWRNGLLVPEAAVTYDTGRVGGWSGDPIMAYYMADLMWVTPSQFAMEIEIKISRADWRADLQKKKWGKFPPWISRFVYAVPEELGVPDWVPPQAGVWHFREGRRFNWDYMRTARAPKRIGKERVPDKVMEKWRHNLYFRFWHSKLYGNLTGLPNLQATAEEEAA